jgi:hypothetical protein
MTLPDDSITKNKVPPIEDGGIGHAHRSQRRVSTRCSTDLLPVLGIPTSFANALLDESTRHPATVHPETADEGPFRARRRSAGMPAFREGGNDELAKKVSISISIARSTSFRE